MHDQAVADDNPRSYPRARVDQRVIADTGILGHRHLPLQARVAPDTHPRPDHTERADGRPLANFGARVDYRGRVDARWDFGRPVKARGDAGHGITGTINKDRGLQPQCLPVRARPQDGGACIALCQRLAIARVHCQCQIFGPRRRGLCRPDNQDFTVTGIVGPDCRRNFVDAQCHFSPASRKRAPGIPGRPTDPTHRLITREPHARPPRPFAAPEIPACRDHRHPCDSSAGPRGSPTLSDMSDRSARV